MGYGIQIKNGNSNVLIDTDKPIPWLTSRTISGAMDGRPWKDANLGYIYTELKFSTTQPDVESPILNFPVGQAIFQRSPTYYYVDNPTIIRVSSNSYAGFSSTETVGLQVSNDVGQVIYDSRAPIIKVLAAFKNPLIANVDTNHRISYTIPSGVTHIQLFSPCVIDNTLSGNGSPPDPYVYGTDHTGWVWERTSSTNLRVFALNKNNTRNNLGGFVVLSRITV